MSYPLALFISFCVGIISITSLKQLALKKKLFMSQGMPLIGGIAIGVSFLLASLVIFLPRAVLSKELVGLFASSLVVLIFGAIDDGRELSVWEKFVVQIIAASILIAFGIRTQIVYIGDILNIIITLVWVIGITNAINHLDVMDGLAGGATIIVAVSFFIIAFLNADTKTMILSLALTGAVLSFMTFNLPPAKIYLGNAGSHYLGFILASMALMLSYSTLKREVALFSPLLILGFPIFDTGYLIWIRLTKKKIPFKKSNDHLALRLLTLGYSKKKALFVMLALCLFFSLGGIFVSQTSNFFGFIILIFVILVSSGLAFRIVKASI